MAERPTIDVTAPVGGWGPPWPNVAEIEEVLPHELWTLVGGLMTQLHAVHHGIGAVRPTDDVDIVLHVETTPGVPGTAARALESIGYSMVEPLDLRGGTAHRFRRGRQTVDLVADLDPGSRIDAVEVVDVLVADHVAPSVPTTLRGWSMVAIEGGTQALRRTVDAHLEISEGRRTVVSVPAVLGALLLKAAAFTTDSRDPERHLLDAAVLLACLDDPFAAREQFRGSDRSRVGVLARNLADDAPAWLLLDDVAARTGQEALRVLAAAPTQPSSRR